MRVSNGGADNDVIDPGIAEVGLKDYINAGADENTVVVKHGYSLVIVATSGTTTTLRFQVIDPSNVRFLQEGDNLVIQTRLRRVDDDIIVVKEVRRLSDTHRMIKYWI